MTDRAKGRILMVGTVAAFVTLAAVPSPFGYFAALGVLALFAWLADLDNDGTGSGNDVDDW